MSKPPQNLNPLIKTNLHKYTEEFIKTRENSEKDNNIEYKIDKYEIFELIKNIKDPEYPLTLEELDIISLDNINVDNEKRIITVFFTPTIETCTLASLIGLFIKKKLMNFIPGTYDIDVLIKNAKNEADINLNKQINDKERIAASNMNDNISEMYFSSAVDKDEYLDFLKS